MKKEEKWRIERKKGMKQCSSISVLSDSNRGEYVATGEIQEDHLLIRNISSEQKVLWGQGY